MKPVIERILERGRQLRSDLAGKNLGGGRQQDGYRPADQYDTRIVARKIY